MLDPCQLLLVVCLAPAALGQTAVISVTASGPSSSFTNPQTGTIASPVSTATGGPDIRVDLPTSLLGETPSGILTTTRSSWVPAVTSAPEPASTQPCNLYVEFCNRRYSDITYVGAHNSPFVKEYSLAANQNLDVKAQLNDGIRMLQGQAHKLNGTIHYCHTSCDLLNAGPVEVYLKTVVGWLRDNPFEVVTVLIGNGGFLNVRDYSEPLEKSGLAELAYIPKERNIKIDQWPTLSEMIQTAGKRAVVFMDYKADEGTIPYILDEFKYMWETPFSQTDENFPCTIDRPSDQPKNDTQGKLYMANHNLNTEFSIAGKRILIPNTVDLEETNGVSGFGSLGLMANTCRADWDRYPNFLLVDFYDVPDGAVFEVAARANNVSQGGGCCGKKKSIASPLMKATDLLLLLPTLAILISTFF
ncbi:PLC-like phosphodiesterase [Tuber magnatum]|uniref:PLC-like phosphodiesterase n=1 Tax=Tuber magnatum TaxID=42249 RepID=A0A317SZ60_9PEZI|nr:PLC-like phosphodiesterase [Tuber magnatum]